MNAERIRLGLFLGGTGVSAVGNVVALVAIPWFVLQTTDSAAQTGIAAGIVVLPSFVSGIFGGVIIDHLGGRRVSVIADIVSGLATLAIPLLYSTVGLSYWQLLMLVFLGAMLDIPGMTARRILLPGFTARTGVKPEALNSANEMVQAAAAIVGPAVAGLLIGPLGASNLLWFTAASFGVSALAVYGFVPNDASEVDAFAEGESFLRRLREGLSFIRHDQVLLTLAIVFSLTNFTFAGMYTVGLPVMTEDRFKDASHWGLLLTAEGLGTLIGGAVYGAIGHRFRHARRMTMAIAFGIQPFIWLPILLSAPYWVMVLALFADGLFGGPLNPLAVTVRFERIPTRLHGRAFATFSAITAVATPLGMFVTGYLFEHLGWQRALLVSMLMYAAVVWSIPVLAPLRGIDKPRERMRLSPELSDSD